MAGREGNEVVVTGVGNFPDDIKLAGEKLLQCLMNPKMGVISVLGFQGVGKWRIAKYATRTLNHSLLSNIPILVELLGEDFSLRKAQKEIARQLRMTMPMEGDGDDEEYIVVTEIYKMLIGPKFLLVLGDVPKGINFELIGDPYLRKLWVNDSKIILVSPQDLQSDISISLEDLSMDMLREEAADITRSPNIGGRFTPDTVLDCFLYLSVFYDGVEVEMLTWCWRAEGFIITEEGEEEDLLMFGNVKVLLTELQVRFMLECKGSTVKLPYPLNGKVEALLTSSERRRLWKTSYDQPTKDDEVEDIQWMALRMIGNISILLPKCPKLTTLILSGGGKEFLSSFKILDTLFFEQIQGLRVLSLQRLVKPSPPKSASCLHNLRVLSLTHCRGLESLLSSFKIFNKLEYLELSGYYDSWVSLPNNVFQQMNNLQYLGLCSMLITLLPPSVSRLHNLRQLFLTHSRNSIQIPDEFFGNLKQLRILILQKNDKQESLPSSLSKLVNLKKLILDGCSSLNMRLLPHLQKLSALEVLDLTECGSLEDITYSLGDILPKLRELYISRNKALRHLSLKACKSLEHVSLSNLTSLEVLGLSGTKLKTLPEGMSGAPLLWRLDMLYMNQIRKINWDDVSTKLQELNLSQCGVWNSSNDDERPGERVGAHIWVSNSKLLQSFSPSSKLWDSKCFSRFHIYISPSQEEKRGRVKSTHHQRRQIVYKDIDSTIQTRNLPRPGSHFDRCLEIRGGHSSPNGIDGVLGRMELFTLCDNDFVLRLQDLGDVNNITKVKECWVERCERMKTFFEGENSSCNTCSCLEKIWMSNLANLRSLCKGTYGIRSFALLKHIYLESCPRLVTVFSTSVFLQSLETLKIILL
ncbi:uncharacterized protein LOC131221352 isoform X1 [Magnolia sinica]|uniref:uncharacterized protein LOC131221352 isoform X1 n=1 Tax=Magnolia sinica TaxID=86752 RepID=UPI002659AEF4|nr:uncharacterized protein LOC131221352 isoform X1 [Magnolia sinica]